MSHFAQPAGGRACRSARQVGRALCARSASRELRTIARFCVFALLLCVVGSACYMYQPIVGPTAPGDRIAVELNDHGRIALTDSLGGFVDRVEGTVQSATDSLIVLRVISVQFLNGQTSNWTNEPVTIRRENIRDVWERRFSRGRTLFAAGGVVGALVAFIGSRSLLGGGTPRTDPPPPPPQGQ